MASLISFAGAVAADAAVSAVSDREPRLAIDARGRLTVSSPPAFLGDVEVKRHLESGLTTSFVFQARFSGPTEEGAARVDIRYELWDEVYLVTVFDGEGRIEESRYESMNALQAWWAEIEIGLSAPVGAAAGGRDGGVKSASGASVGAQVRLSLAVVPFSQAELVDTQKWLTESIGQAQGGARAGRESGASRAVGALIATSMQRRAIRSMSWSLPIVRRTQP